ncbi:MAG: MFS transporter [Candidatus Bathyarchaeia archaeon]
MRQSISVIAVALSHGIMHAYLVLLPALVPLMKDELGNFEMIGLLVSLVFLFYGWGSLPVGFIADRYSRKALIVASMALCGLSTIIVSVSASLALTMIALIILGIGASLYHPPGYAHMSLLSLEMRGRYMGLQGLGGDLGMAMSYFSSVFLGSLLGWRSTFLVWGLIGLAMAILDMVLISDTENESQASNQGYAETLRGVLKTEHLRTLLLVFLIIILSGALWNGVSSWILTYINHVKGVQLIIAGGLSTISYTIGSFAQIIGGELSDKKGRRIILLIGFGLFSASLFALTLVQSSLLLILVIVSLLGFTFYVTQSPLNALLGDISPKKTVGVTYGINFSIKYGVGAFAPVVAGYLASNYSLDHVFYFFALISAIAFILTFFVKDVRNHS